jgi:hypothetical protein
MKSLYLKIEHIVDKSIEELDHMIIEEFGFDEKVYDNVVEIKEGIADVNTEPININTLIESLNKMKMQGCTHVTLDYHFDHIGYDMSGFKITEATIAERDSFILESLRKKEIEERKTRLRKELRDLEKEGIKQIKKDVDEFPF